MAPHPDRSVTVARDEESAAAACEMFRLEVRAKALCGRIELGQGDVERCDQSSRVGGVEWLGHDREAQVLHLTVKSRTADAEARTLSRTPARGSASNQTVASRR
jgi:hypothetical protein